MKKKDKITLADYARQENKEYMEVYTQYKRGEFHTEKSPSGRIFITGSKAIPEKPGRSLKEFAEDSNITYRTAWTWYKKGYLETVMDGKNRPRILGVKQK